MCKRFFGIKSWLLQYGACGYLDPCLARWPFGGGANISRKNARKHIRSLSHNMCAIYYHECTYMYVWRSCNALALGTRHHDMATKVNNVLPAWIRKCMENVTPSCRLCCKLRAPPTSGMGGASTRVDLIPKTPHFGGSPLRTGALLRLLTLDLWSRRPKLLTNQIWSLGLPLPWNGGKLKSDKNRVLREVPPFLKIIRSHITSLVSCPAPIMYMFVGGAGYKTATLHGLPGQFLKLKSINIVPAHTPTSITRLV